MTIMTITIIINLIITLIVIIKFIISFGYTTTYYIGNIVSISNFRLLEKHMCVFKSHLKMKIIIIMYFFLVIMFISSRYCSQWCGQTKAFSSSNSDQSRSTGCPSDSV